MGAHSDRIAQLDTLISQVQKQVDWIQGNSNTWEMYYGDPLSLQESFTGNGADAFLTQWRTNNPSASSSSTGYELEVYNMWKYWSDNGSDMAAQNSSDLTTLQSDITNFNTEKSNVQAKIDAGYTGDETVEEAQAIAEAAGS